MLGDIWFKMYIKGTGSYFWNVNYTFSAFIMITLCCAFLFLLFEWKSLIYYTRAHFWLIMLCKKYFMVLQAAFEILLLLKSDHCNVFSKNVFEKSQDMDANSFKTFAHWFLKTIIEKKVVCWMNLIKFHIFKICKSKIWVPTLSG